MSQLRKLVDIEHGLSVRQQCDLLEIHRSGLYYKPCDEKPENLEIMRLMDEHYLDHPTEGVIRMQDFFLALGFVVNHKRVAIERFLEKNSEPRYSIKLSFKPKNSNGSERKK